MSTATTPATILRYEHATARCIEKPDRVAAEAPLEVRVEGTSVAVVMRTPGNDRELAAGFAFTEGIVNSAEEIFDITSCIDPGSAKKGNVIDIGLARPTSFDPRKLTRHVFTSSSCGVCSKASIALVMKDHPPIDDPVRVDPALLMKFPALLRERQEAFHQTGGLHACALFAPDGTLVDVREDVGRHNALDKLIGAALLARRLPLAEQIVLFSGRASFELMQKAYAARIPIVAAISAPSSLAVEFAVESGQTLVGFVRDESMNIYAGAERLQP
jgi:FdhD protein